MRLICIIFHFVLHFALGILGLDYRLLFGNCFASETSLQVPRLQDSGGSLTMSLASLATIQWPPMCCRCTLLASRKAVSPKLQRTDALELLAEPSQANYNNQDIDEAQIRNYGHNVQEDLLIRLECLQIDTG